MLQQLDCGADGWGTFQYAAAGEATLYELGQAILSELAISSAPVLVDDAEPWTRLEPENATLGCHKIRNTFGIKQLPWQDAIADEYRLLRTEQTGKTPERSTAI